MIALAECFYCLVYCARGLIMAQTERVLVGTRRQSRKGASDNTAKDSKLTSHTFIILHLTLTFNIHSEDWFCGDAVCGVVDVYGALHHPACQAVHDALQANIGFDEQPKVGRIDAVVNGGELSF